MLKAKHNTLAKREGVKLFLYVLPCIALIVIFKYLPMWGWAYAFFSYKPGKPLSACEFVGMKNFVALFSNKVMRGQLFQSLKNTFGIHILGYLFSPLPMLFAIFLTEVKGRRFKKVVQTLTTLPHFIGWVVVYSLATALFAPNGMVNNLFISLGLREKAINYLASDKHVWLTQVAWQQWKNLGWDAIIYFAAIAGIDSDLYEAAALDGASRMQSIRYITIPQLIPTYFTLLIINIGKFLNTGTDQYLTFSNAMNKQFIEVLDLYVYNLGMGNGLISYSVAVGIMKTIVAFILFSTANWLSKKVRGNSVF